MMFMIVEEEMLVFEMVTLLQTKDVEQEQLLVLRREKHRALFDDRRQMFEEQQTEPGVDQVDLIDLFHGVARIDVLILLVVETLGDVVHVVHRSKVAHDRRGEKVGGNVLGNHMNLFEEGLVVDEESRTHVALHPGHGIGVVRLVLASQEVAVFLERTSMNRAVRKRETRLTSRPPPRMVSGSCVAMSLLFRW